jgi:hypothetical protein
MTFCGSTFLLALLLPGDFFHVHSAPVAARFRESVPFTPLAELEVTNTLRRALREGIASRKEHDVAFRQIEKDLADGILVWSDPSHSELYRIARELSRRRTPEIPARSLDIPQTASALVIGAGTPCSFDEWQRRLATAAGLKLLPRAMLKPTGPGR